VKTGSRSGQGKQISTFERGKNATKQSTWQAHKRKDSSTFFSSLSVFHTYGKFLRKNS